jgi:hypothetical protein
MQLYTVYLYLETAIHVSGGTSTHHQEHTQLYLQHLVFVTPLLLSAAVLEELEPLCSLYIAHPLSGGHQKFLCSKFIFHFEAHSYVWSTIYMCIYIFLYVCVCIVCVCVCVCSRSRDCRFPLVQSVLILKSSHSFGLT